MNLKATDLLDFYATPLGARTAETLGARISTWWPDLKGQRVLTSGFGVPLDSTLMSLDPLSLSHFVPARIRVAAKGTTGREVITDDTLMPLSSDEIDRVILLHRLEEARRPDRTFREVWRVLKPGGKLIVVVPSAFGLWARLPSNPYGKGQAFTGLRLAATLSEQLFSLERMRNALFFPPHSSFKWMRLPTGGVLIAEAQKLAGPAHLLQSPSPALKPRQAAPVAKQETRSRDHGRNQETSGSR